MIRFSRTWREAGTAAQPGFFDSDERLRALSAASDPLAADAAARRAEADEALALAEADLARALDAAGPDVKAAIETEIQAIRDLGDEGVALERAAVAASACLKGN